MKLELLGTFGGSTRTNALTSFLVNDSLAIDAGSLTQFLSLERQVQISDILISHSHLDHTLCLPFLADNMFGERDQPIRIWASKVVIEGLKAHVFNEVIWPDFTVLPNAETPTIQFQTFEPEQPFRIGDLEIIAIPVNHVVPCHGFLVRSVTSGSSFLYTSDTTTTDRIWELANAQPHLEAVIVDCSFPNAYRQLATISGHMTPELLGMDLAKLSQPCQILIYHLKPNFRDVLEQELKGLGLAHLETELQGRTFFFTGPRGGGG